MLYRLFALLLQQAEAVWRTVVKTGTGLIVANDTTEGQPVGLQLQGWTTQDGEPSPENPVDIVNAGKYNSETKKYKVEVKLTGKNIINIPEISKNTGTVNIPVFLTRNIYISFQGEMANVTSGQFRISVSYKNGTKLYLYDSGVEKGSKFVTDYDNPIVNITYRGTGIQDGKYTKIQIEYGEEKTEYQEYKEQTVTVTSDRPITKWDRLVEKDGQIGWEYKSKTYEITGSESGIFTGGDSYTQGSSTNMYFKTSEMGIKGSSVNVQNAYMKDYIFYPGIWNKAGEFGHCINGTEFHLRIPNKIIGISDDALKEEKYNAYKQYLKKMYNEKTPLQIFCESITSEFLPLPSEEQETIRELKTYYPTTVFSNDNEMFMQVEYQTKVPEQEV